MNQFVFTNSASQSITLGKPTSGKIIYLITKFDGLEHPSVNLQTQKAPYQDGVSYIGTLFGSRVVSLTGSINYPQDWTNIWSARASLQSVLNPKLGVGTLRITTSAGSWDLKQCVSSIVLKYKEWMNPCQEFLITFEGLDPYLYATSASTQAYAYGETKTLANAGQYETPILIELADAIVNPRINNTTTGEYIKFTKTMSAGDTLKIYTAFGQKYVIYTPSGGSPANGIGYVDSGSTFWQLATGNNSVQLTGTSGSGTGLITWYNRYIGC